MNIPEYLKAHPYGGACHHIAIATGQPIAAVISEVEQGIKSGLYLSPRGWVGNVNGKLKKTIVLAELWPGMAKAIENRKLMEAI